jgi:hypothetical protein
MIGDWWVDFLVVVVVLSLLVFVVALCKQAALNDAPMSPREVAQAVRPHGAGIAAEPLDRERFPALASLGDEFVRVAREQETGR